MIQIFLMNIYYKDVIYMAERDAAPAPKMVSVTDGKNEKNYKYYSGKINEINKIIQKSSIKKLPVDFVKSGNEWKDNTANVFKNWANKLYNASLPRTTVNSILLEYTAACGLRNMKYSDANGPLANYYTACLWITTGTFLNMLIHLINTKGCCVTMKDFGGQGPEVKQDPTPDDLGYDKALLKSLTDNFAPAWHYTHNNWYKYSVKDSLIDTALDAAYIKDKVEAIKNKRSYVEEKLK